jgi:uncharacterized membrane protein
MVKLNKTDEQVIATLKEGGELTLQELSEKTGESSKKVFKSLRKLFEHELIETKARKYKPKRLAHQKTMRLNCLND